MSVRPSGAPPEVSQLTIEYPLALPSMANARLHWAAKARKVTAQRATTELAMRANGVGWRLRPLKAGEHLTVRLVRVSPRRLDDDNNVGAFKAVRDSVAAFFHVDDRDPRIRFEYGQAKGKACVRIDFEVTT